MTDCILCDIDGTIADLAHRLHYVKLRRGSRVKMKGTQGPFYKVLDIREFETIPVIAMYDHDEPVQINSDVETKVYLDQWEDGESGGWYGLNEITFKKHWGLFFDAMEYDEPIPHIIDMVSALHRAGETIVFMSGRPDSHRRQTEDWLRKHFQPGCWVWGQAHKIVLPYMRAAGDYRPDHEVKSDLLDRVRADGFRPKYAIDDRTQVVQMWRSRGLPCLQVAEGDF